MLTGPNAAVAWPAPVTLTVTVSAGGLPVAPGSVNFCNAAAPSCSGQALLGHAQLKANGTASLTTVLPFGTYSVIAQFPGTSSAVGSTSAPLSGVTLSGSGDQNVVAKYPASSVYMASTSNALSLAPAP